MPLQIEVKTSIRGNDSKFFLTRNEWNVAEESKNYFFHFWLIEHPNKILFYCCDKQEISANIPADQGSGEWQQVCICFSLFKARMKRIVCPGKEEILERFLASQK
jgi:hypothetical protein